MKTELISTPAFLEIYHLCEDKVIFIIDHWTKSKDIIQTRIKSIIRKQIEIFWYERQDMCYLKNSVYLQEELQIGLSKREKKEIDALRRICRILKEGSIF